MMTGLLELPPEVMAVVCYHLSSTSLAALDSTCTSLHWTLDRALVWTARARRVNEACAYGCTTGMLEVARERSVEDQRVFKVILGLRKVIKTAVRRFMRRDIEGFSCWKHMMIYRPRGPGSFHAFQAFRALEESKIAFKKMCQAFVSENVQNMKAWGREPRGPNASLHGRRLCEELLEDGEEVEVDAVLAALAAQAEIVFQDEMEKAKEDITMKLEAILGSP